MLVHFSAITYFLPKSRLPLWLMLPELPGPQKTITKCACCQDKFSSAEIEGKTKRSEWCTYPCTPCSTDFPRALGGHREDIQGGDRTSFGIPQLRSKKRVLRQNSATAAATSEYFVQNTKNYLSIRKQHSGLQTHPSLTNLTPPNYKISQMQLKVNCPILIHITGFTPPFPKCINWKTQVKNISPTFCRLFQSSLRFLTIRLLFSWVNKGSLQIFIK